MNATQAYALSKSYTDKSLDGMGALKGAPCQIQDITNISGGKLVTFLWVDNNGTPQTSTMTVMDGEEGKGIASAVITDSHLIITYTDGTSVDAGTIDFGTGFSATATLSANAWVNNQQTVTFTGYTASMNGVIGVPSTMSGAQLLAYKNAGVYVVSQSGNQVTFGCDNVPSSDLPVGIYAGGNGGSGEAVWGGITGTLANQTDLQTALNAKLDASYAEIVAGGSNLVDFDNCKYGWRPSASYTEGTNDPTAFTTNLIPCERNEKIKFYIEDMSIRITVYAFYSNGNLRNTTETFVLDDDGYYYVQPNFSDIAYIAFCPRGTGSTRANFETLVVGRYDTFSMTDIQFPDLYLCDKNVSMAKDRLKYVDDVLFGKKWAVAGDSFTAGTAISETIPSGKYAGQTAVYPYLIGSRTGMNILSYFAGGRTLAYPTDETSTNSFAYVYQNIPADTDYLTIYLGINDSHKASAEEGQIPLGTITDNTTATFYGAWNVILSWLIENRPNLKIGIIVSNGCETDDYRVATIEMATKYGIPYIDLNGDSKTPCMLRSTNPNIATAVKNQRTLNWRLSSENQHPNAACHAFESIFIENFLRSL